MKTPKDSYTETSSIARPVDANSIGTIFGGHIMQLMDETAAICARRHSNARVSTVSVESMNFYKPILVGHVITVTAIICRAFKTSMDIKVEVWAADTYNNTNFLAANANFIVVGMTKQNNPCQLPELEIKTRDEIKRWEQAGIRREKRKNNN